MKKIVKELIPIMAKQWPDWTEDDDRTSEEVYGEVIEDAIDLLGEASIKKFMRLGWQEQDEILNVLQAIREE
jgi:hypothetical protein